jgi:hypothetical protein
MFIEIPAKVLLGQTTAVNTYALWPYNGGSSDLYWAGGSNPKYYQWQVTLTITAQTHSSYKTRQPYSYTGMDVNVGDYIADLSQGISLKIISVTSKSDSTITCIVEDILRYNTFRDPTSSGNGVFGVSANIMIFELNEEGMPIIDPTPSFVSPSVVNNLIARFTNFEESYNFILTQPNNGFALGDLIAANPADNGFVLANSAYPYLVGTVTNTNLGTDDFMINPFQKITDGYDTLLGTVGSVVYADPTNSGEMTLTGQQPILIKLRQETNTIVTGSTLTSDANTAVGGVLKINSIFVTIGNTGSAADFVDAVNVVTANTDVIAELIVENPTASTDPSALAGGPGVIFVQIPSEVNINGTVVTITTTTSGNTTFGSPGFADQYDVATDINAAAITGLTATGTSTGVTIINTAGSINLTNIGVDAAGNPFAGPNSSTGLPLVTISGGGEYITLTSIGAGAINILDTSGSPADDFGLYSAENGVKAAAIIIEQGVRAANTYYVTNIVSRNGLTAVVGDQAYVQDVGDGTWALYLYNGSSWIMIANQPSSETDAQTDEVIITPFTANTAVIHTITNNRRVSFVTVTVSQAFDTAATISVGDAAQNDRLMTVDQNDLTVVGDYSTTPSYTYASGSDTPISFYFDTAGSTVGNAIVAITYT